MTQLVRLSPEEIAEASRRLEQEPAQAVLAWASETFGPQFGLAASFGAEDVVLIDMLAELGAGCRIFTIDTGRLPDETYQLMDRIRERYGVNIEVYFPRPESVEPMVRAHGLNLFYRSVQLRQLCCHVRKVEPLERALASLAAWATGLRREQAATREGVRKVELDSAHGGIVKVNPLADWTWEQVWAYIRRRDVPYNVLHDRGYPSIGCAPCTRPVAPGEDLRAGRWWWERDAHKECGLHLPAARSDGNGGGRHGD